MSQPRKSREANSVEQYLAKCFYWSNLRILKNWRFTKKTGAMPTHRARKYNSACNQTIRKWLVFTTHQSRITSHFYFFGLDSGGTIPLVR